VTTIRRTRLNNAVTRFRKFAAPAYDLQVLQRWVYRPAQDEVVAQLQTDGSRGVADIACGTGVLADRIERELHPDEVYGVDMSEGMLAQAQARSSKVQWLRGPAEQLPFGDGTLDTVVTTWAFHFFDQPAALREFHRALGAGGAAGGFAPLTRPRVAPSANPKKLNEESKNRGTNKQARGGPQRSGLSTGSCAARCR
jgi:ubiquinone/menaquinone biosynthesis C-methylase UbiE